MYEGCNKTAISSRNAIADALLSLMREKPYARITISGICKEADVSRQTFYAHFPSKDSVVSYALERKYCFHPEEHECCRGSMALKDICRAYSDYIVDQQDILEILVRNDLLYLMQSSLYDCLLSSPAYLSGYPADDRVYAADFLAGGLTGIARNYILQDDRARGDHLESLLYSLLSGAFFR